MMLFAPAAVQEGQIGEHDRPKTNFKRTGPDCVTLRECNYM